MDSSQTHLFKERNRKLVFYESREFKDAEKARREASKPKDHVILDNDRVYCPEVDRIRPTWLCEQEHGDRNPYFDMDREE